MLCQNCQIPYGWSCIDGKICNGNFITGPYWNAYFQRSSYLYMVSRILNSKFSQIPPIGLFLKKMKKRRSSDWLKHFYKVESWNWNFMKPSWVACTCGKIECLPKCNRFTWIWPEVLSSSKLVTINATNKFIKTRVTMTIKATKRAIVNPRAYGSSWAEYSCKYSN